MDPDMKIRVYGDVAVATNWATIKEKYSGKATAGQFHSSLVFAKMPTGWQLVCNQIIPITSPYVRRSFFLNRGNPGKRHARRALQTPRASEVEGARR